MSTVTIDSHRRHLDTIAREVADYAEAGNDVILKIGDSVPPERILKILRATAGAYRIDITVRHAELKEYLEHALVGAAVGGFLGGAASLLTALSTGSPIAIKSVLAATGIGAAIGTLLGISSTPIASCTVYKTHGETRIKFLSSETA